MQIVVIYGIEYIASGVSFFSIEEGVRVAVVSGVSSVCYTSLKSDSSLKSDEVPTQVGLLYNHLLVS